MSQPVEAMNALSLVSLAVLCVLWVRKLIVMDGLLKLRAVILTALLWAALFGLFFMACPTHQSDCMITFND